MVMHGRRLKNSSKNGQESEIFNNLTLILLSDLKVLTMWVSLSKFKTQLCDLKI